MAKAIEFYQEHRANSMSTNLSNVLESGPMDTSSRLDRLLDESSDESPIAIVNGTASILDEIESPKR